MNKVLYKFRNYKVSPETRILIIGTFNPDIEENRIDFFYSRPKNYLWRILPEVYGKESLKESTTERKVAFIENYQIDFTDLIASVRHLSGKANYSDSYLEKQELEWNKTEELLKSLINLKLVLFTRRTFQGVPNLRNRFLFIQKECEKLKIVSRFVVTPTRHYSTKKLEEWKFAIFNKPI